MTSSHFSRAVLALSLAIAGFSRADPGYHLAAEIPISGEGGWDYLSVDSDAKRLYVTHNTQVVVIDTAKDAVVSEIKSLQGVHGFAVAADLNLGYASNGREGTVAFIRLSDLKEMRRVQAGENPDAILYEPKGKEVYAFNGRSRSASVFDALTGSALATIPLAAKPEFAQADTKRSRVYVNLEDKSQLAVIDIHDHKVTAMWDLAPGTEPSGLVFDEAHGRIFVGCSNALIEVLDTADGQIVASIPAGAGIDACAFDPTTKLVFSSNGEDGTVTIAHQDSADKYSVVQTLTTEKGARTMQVDPATHKIYLASARFDSSGDKERPRMVAGSMKILVYEMAKTAP